MKTPWVDAVACALLSSLAVGFAASQDAVFDPRDFSTSNSVAVLLVQRESSRLNLDGG
jgi:hypothetical protein